MRALKIIGSWWLTAAICAVGVVGYAVCAQGEIPFDRWSHLLLRTAPGLALYAGLILNLIAVSVRIALFKLVPSAGHIREMDEYVEAATSQLGGPADDVLTGWLRRHKYYVTARDRVIIGIRGRFSFIPGVILRLGLVIMLIAIGCSSHIRQTEEMILHSSEPARILNRAISTGSIRAALPESFLQVGDRATFELDDLSVDVVVGGKSATVTSGYAARVNGLYLRVTDFGYSIPVMIDGTEVGRNLEVLPPAKTQRIKTPSGAEAAILIEPAKTMTKGLLTGKAYNLQAPRFRVKTDGADEGVVLAPGESSGRVSLGLSAGYFVRLMAVSDPALIWVYAGGAIFLAGIVLMLSRFFWYERRIAAGIEGDMVIMGESAELYNNWWVDRFRAMLDELGLRPSAREDKPDASQ